MILPLANYHRVWRGWEDTRGLNAGLAIKKFNLVSMAARSITAHIAGVVAACIMAKFMVGSRFPNSDINLEELESWEQRHVNIRDVVVSLSDCDMFDASHMRTHSWWRLRRFEGIRSEAEVR